MNESDKKTPIKHNFDEMLAYFRVNPDKLKHYITVMKVRYNLNTKDKNDKTT